YIMKEPGLAPDALIPINPEKTDLFGGRWESLWVTVDLDGTVSAGEYNIDITFEYSDRFDFSTEMGERDKQVVSMTVNVIDALLPPQKIKLTQWFHCDCIASYFNVKIFSEEHWAYMENFIKVAVKNGINMILTPIFTPPLDTEIGSERPTVQLVRVMKDEENYSFDFTLLDRWVEMCQSCGIKYFEMAHLFTQWGAKATPKIVAQVDGEEKRIFGWDVPSTSEMYKSFLSQFLPALDAYLKKKGIADVVYFHISDEPHGDEAKKNYIKAKSFVEEYLSGYKIMDALSDVVFYDEGIVKLPVPASNHIAPFLQKDLPERWTYYCMGEGKGVSNRFIAMPSYRNRVIAEQMFKYNIDGFLQWGYNFYYSQLSRALINPYVITDADGAFQSGDAFSVYPYGDGAAESLRIIVFADALQDMRAMELLASRISHDKVVELIEKEAGMSIEFDQYPKSSEYILRRREIINRKIREICK
ncbi:MAG: DUF4091 domain-containing protein, partial [Oscillospiraceae bacterium]|nr:DUF4091 domain-containing protein [Oscillospiraceae bacterium]